MNTITIPPVPATTSGPPPRSAVPAPARGAGVFGTMLRQECRELAVPLLLIGLVYSVILAAVLYNQANQIAAGKFNGDYSMAVSSGFMIATLIVSALGGMGVGFVQFIFESRRDQFAFFTHRPASRSMLFWSKAGPGAAMLFLTLALPALVAMVWLGNPHHIPLPFSWRMGQIPLADNLCGVAYYFAGVLVAVRMDARWYGLRLLPLAAPIVLTMASIASPGFTRAAFCIAVGGAAMAAVAQGYFQAAGQYQRVNRVIRPVLGTVLLVALFVAGFIVLGITELITEPTRPYVAAAKNVVILSDGTVAIAELARPTKDAATVWHLTDVAGKPLPHGPEFVDYSKGINALALYPMTTVAAVLSEGGPFHEPQHYFSNAGQFADATWSRSVDNGNGDYLVGFDMKNRERVGSVGPDGFVPRAATPVRYFAKPLLTDLMGEISAGPDLYKLTEDRSVVKLLTTPNHEEIIGLGLMMGTVPEGAVRGTRFTVLMTLHAVMVASTGDHPAILARYEIENPTAFDVKAGFAASTKLFLLQFTPRGISPRPVFVVYLTADGAFDHKATLPDMTPPQPPAPVDVVTDYLMPALVPPVGVAAARHMGIGEAEVPQEILQKAMRWSGGLAALLAALTFMLAWRRQFGAVATGTWTLLTLLLGPAGLLLMFALRGLGTTVPCPACGKSRRVDLAACPHCGAAFLLPPANGTEIVA